MNPSVLESSQSLVIKQETVSVIPEEATVVFPVEFFDAESLDALHACSSIISQSSAPSTSNGLSCFSVMLCPISDGDFFVQGESLEDDQRERRVQLDTESAAGDP